MSSKTIYIGPDGIEKELIQLDQFREWIHKLEAQFIAQKEYSGYPMLPDCIHEYLDLWEAADEQQRRLMFISVVGRLMEAYRHWKRNLDDLYGKDGWNRFMYID